MISGIEFAFRQLPMLDGNPGANTKNSDVRTYMFLYQTNGANSKSGIRIALEHLPMLDGNLGANSEYSHALGDQTKRGHMSR